MSESLRELGEYDYRPQGSVVKTTRWDQGRFSFSSFRVPWNKGTWWLKVDCHLLLTSQPSKRKIISEKGPQNIKNFSFLCLVKFCNEFILPKSYMNLDMKYYEPYGSWVTEMKYFPCQHIWSFFTGNIILHFLAAIWFFLHKTVWFSLGQ